MASKLSSILGIALRSSPSLRSRTRFPPLRSMSTTDDTSQSQTPAAAVDEANTPPPPPPAVTGDGSDNYSVDSTLVDYSVGSTGLAFAKITGVGKNTLKTDVIHLLEGCKLTLEDIKVEYNRFYNPIGILLQLPSDSAFKTANAEIKKAYFYKLVKVDRSQWDMQESFNGKTVLLQGIPRNALPEDIERFLSGCDFDSSEIKFLMRPGLSEPVRMALVRFPSRNEALHAFRVKNRSFCLNNTITMRVLE